MTQGTDNFIADLQRLIAQWEKDVIQLEQAGEIELANQVEIWISDAERIVEKSNPSLDNATVSAHGAAAGRGEPKTG